MFKKSKAINHHNHKKYLSKVLLVLMLLSISSILIGCQVSEKERWFATYKDEIKIREANVETYLLYYLEKKYHEKFISHGINGGELAWDMKARKDAMLSFHIESVQSGIEFEVAYRGSYIHPESAVDINEYQWIDDDDYWLKKRNFDFKIRETKAIEDLFPGYRPSMSISFSLVNPPYSFDFFRDQVALDSKYLDVEYYLKEEKDKLNEYRLSMDYFRDVTEENKKEILQDVYKFIQYTRSIGFKNCALSMNVFDEELMESEEYKRYLEDEQGIDLGMNLRLAGKKTITINVDTSEMENINSVEDLEKYHVMYITKEKVDK